MSDNDQWDGMHHQRLVMAVAIPALSFRRPDEPGLGADAEKLLLGKARFGDEDAQTRSPQGVKFFETSLPDGRRMVRARIKDIVFLVAGHRRGRIGNFARIEAEAEGPDLGEVALHDRIALDVDHVADRASMLRKRLR